MSDQSSLNFDLSMLDEATLEALRFAGSEPIPTDKVEMRIAPDFLNAAECAIFMRMIDEKRAPSVIYGAEGDPHFRTSETCYFPVETPIVRALELRLALFMGIPPEYSETVQGQRYAVGQEFKPHADYFHAANADGARHLAHAGQRTWTAMIYLNDVEEGGMTYFHHIARAFVPQAGALLIWNNITPDGKLNSMTLHHGQPVVRGTKYVLTKWYRERPYIIV